MFEELLADPPTRGRNRLPFTVAVALHAAAAVAIVGASLWSVEEAPEPEIPISPIVRVPPPPAGAGSASASRPRSPDRARRIPVAVPRELPAPEENAAPETDALPAPEPDGGLGTGVATSGEAGVPGGVPGGTGTDPEASGPLDGDADAIFPPGGDVRAPLLVARTEPAYPEPARRAGIEGDVVLEAIITPSGDVEEVRVVKSAGPLLDRAAREAVGDWRYRPATLNGRAVRVRLTVVVSFRLH